MSGCICFSKKRNCYNVWETYYTCIGCGCCSKDKLVRYHSRIDLHERLIEEAKNFSDWADTEEVRNLQRENMDKNRIWGEKKIRYYKKKLEALSNGT